MIEGEPGNDHSFEEAYASLQKAVEDVLTGYRRRVDILVKQRNPWTGKTKVSFPPLPSVSPKVAHQAVEALKMELGYETYNSWYESGKKGGRRRFFREGETFHVPTIFQDVDFTRREIYEMTVGDELAGEVWSLENLQPMSWRGVLGFKANEIFQRALAAADWA